MTEKKNHKFTNELKRIGPKLKWFLFTEMQDLKLTSDYIDLICPTGDKKSEIESNPVESLRKLIEQSLIREFSPKIQNLRSFNHLVDTIMHNIQKKALGDDNELETLLSD
ncbi:MAG TPA: hypothetical protein P5556_01740 [Candidatus Gastranaerophilales bacterium]|nr:hypothetical protein [Candidatus Gastranaerophilales bacterium]